MSESESDALPLGYTPTAVLLWQGQQDSNLRITESKSVALPLGDAPTSKWGE